MTFVLGDDRIDALVSTSPKDSTHLVGLAAPRSRLAWIADFRDGWTFESTRPPLPTRAQRALDARLEASVVRNADAVVAFSRTLVADFERRLARRAFYVPNGYDPEPDQAPDADEPVLAPSRGKIRLVYTGTLTGAAGAPTDRSPLPLLEALDVLSQQDRGLAERLELIIAGRRNERDEAILRRFAHVGAIEHVGYLARPTALALQRSADVLVAVSGTTPSSIPLKLFEYLGARRPILHLGHPGEAARLLDDTGVGVTVSLDDREAIVAALRTIALAEFAESYAPRNLEQYSYPYVAQQMAEVIERAIARRRNQRRNAASSS